ncbi:putative late blight resistance proteinR1A-10 [Sesamum alatum]|uniref:Late blight resistance proteinR1A-10 n=1 Tax=Sesamum alatum TaxID=300844 RepID=A0AAE1YRM4_9LAMI|nr:putative late blight resistance proteinR1A-10 [Sesamum alatum]
MDELTRDEPNLQIFPIIGMGGIGKTTLARSTFVNPYVVHFFEKRIWLRISQEYSIREILVGLLNDGKDQESNETLAELGERLYKSLCHQRYLIVMDDVWSTRASDDLKLFFPNNRNGSQVILTTRLSSVAVSLGSHNPYLVNFLDDAKSWNLLCQKVFAQEVCPHPELEEIENVNSLANLGSDDYCLKILSLSYNNLPIHLKPCFLYFGVFLEDHDIFVSELMKLWVVEGFIKPTTNKSLEEVAEDYLNDLIGRNLILVQTRRLNGKANICTIHGLLRDLCLREFEKEHFIHVPKVQYTSFSKVADDRCLGCCHATTLQVRNLTKVLSHVVSQSAALASLPVYCAYRNMTANLVRIRSAPVKYSDKEFLHPTRLRCLCVLSFTDLKFVSPSMIHVLWNLQILDLDAVGREIVLPYEIWEMPQLRNIRVYSAPLPDPRVSQDCTILENLQKLSFIKNLQFSEEILERIPNLKKLRICYVGDMEWSYYGFHMLACFLQLKSLYIYNVNFSLENITFPVSLKKLTLSSCKIPWEDMTILCSLLPNLEELELYENAFKGNEWNQVEGEFPRLKILLIFESDLLSWRLENIHFPILETLVLRRMHLLEEIPSGIGDIPTLQLIELRDCRDSVVNSAKRILEEQQSLGNESLQLDVL